MNESMDQLTELARFLSTINDLGVGVTIVNRPWGERHVLISGSEWWFDHQGRFLGIETQTVTGFQGRRVKA